MIHRLPIQTPLIQRLFDRIADEQSRLDHVIIEGLEHQLKGAKETMDDIHNAIKELDNNERAAAQKIRKKIENIKELRSQWDDPNQIDRIIKDLKELADILEPNGKNSEERGR